MYNQIATRRSVRTFSKVPFNDVDVKRIEDILTKLSSLKTPFGNLINLELLNQASGENEKIGTYGFVHDLTQIKLFMNLYNPPFALLKKNA
jgi:hypothetical protein